MSLIKVMLVFLLDFFLRELLFFGCSFHEDSSLTCFSCNFVNASVAFNRLLWFPLPFSSARGEYDHADSGHKMVCTQAVCTRVLRAVDDHSFSIQVYPAVL